MNIIKKIVPLVTLCLSMSMLSANAITDSWHNDLRSKFLNNEAKILEVNIRTFNAKDLDGDGFINEEKGEIKGTFLNAIDRLDEIKNLGINTLHVLPITPVGKLKALGTAGSLYSAASYNSLNPDMYDKTSELSLEEQAKKFIEEAHKRNIRIIVDIPACASYDLYLQRPDLFVTNSAGDPIVPSDWTDVRLLASGTEDKINQNVFSLYKEFVKYMMNLGVDGIRADVAHSKTAIFWKGLIDYSRNINPEFLWLAESSDSWSEAISPMAVYTPYDKLLEAGFDGFYGSFFNIKDWKNAKELNSQISENLKQTKNFNQPKSVIGSFTTHDEISPILLKGPELSDMIIWLSATLPVNSYFPDGFQTGDDYLYKMGNKLAPNSNTDDDLYFTHRGKIDIFNFSRKPEGNNTQIRNNFLLGNNVKTSLIPILNSGVYTPLKTKNSQVFAYTFSNGIKRVITIGNLDFNENQKAVVKIPQFNKQKMVMMPIKISTMPVLHNGKLYLELKKGEIVVVTIVQPL